MWSWGGKRMGRDGSDMFLASTCSPAIWTNLPGIELQTAQREMHCSYSHFLQHLSPLISAEGPEIFMKWHQIRYKNIWYRFTWEILNLEKRFSGTGIFNGWKILKSPHRLNLCWPHIYKNPRYRNRNRTKLGIMCSIKVKAKPGATEMGCRSMCTPEARPGS